MGALARFRRWFFEFLILAPVALSGTSLAAQQQVLGAIIGHIRLVRGDVPPQAVLVTLEFRGSAIDSVYTDSQGTFGFHNLGPSPYTVTVNDDKYEPVRESAIIEPNSLDPLVFLDIHLVPKASGKANSDSPPKPVGANPNMIDVREYADRFSKPAVKEFKKALSLDSVGKREEAIRHYQKAVAIAPDFYLAHNNLGSDYLSKSDLPSALKEFERVVELNQSDAAAYFNLSNVCMLMGQLQRAQQNLSEGMRRQPDSALGQFLLGSLSLRLGKPDEAETALKHAVQLDPTMASARLQLVNLLLKQGRKQEAAGLLHEFLGIFPDGPYSAQAKQVLNRLESQTASP